MANPVEPLVGGRAVVMVDLERQQARQWLEELAQALEHWRLVLVSGSHLFAGAMVWTYPG